jgi:uncharacterized membrane protein YfcA
VAFYQIIARSTLPCPWAPDWSLGVLFGIGGMVGMYLVRAAARKYVPARYIKWMLAGCILFLAAKYVRDFLV